MTIEERFLSARSDRFAPQKPPGQAGSESGREKSARSVRNDGVGGEAQIQTYCGIGLFVAEGLHGIYAHGAVSWDVAGDKGGEEQKDGDGEEGDRVVGSNADQEAG
jgi:hypothetical protein